MLTGWGFAKKGTKILRHWGSKVNRHSEALAEESFLKGAKLLRHYGTKRVLKKCAFTLSEVLIVLAVLGVVAAMTIPDLIQDYREKALITALKKNYSIFEQAVEMAQVDNGPIASWDIGTENTADGAQKLYNIIKPYLRIDKECGTEKSNGKNCFASHYKALFNDNYLYQPAVHGVFARGTLVSGVSFLTWSNGNTSCSSSGWCGFIGVDVNGKTGPNRVGVDYFRIMLYNTHFSEKYGLPAQNGLVPCGQWTTGHCVYNDSDTLNGYACTYWALKHENMDYLRKDGKYTKW